MRQIPLAAAVRTELGKQAVKHLRAEGFIPAVVYRRGKEVVSLKVERQKLHHILHTGHGENVVIALTVTGDTKEKQRERPVMIKEIQQEPVHGNILHVDFHEISLSEKLKVNIPIETKGEPVGVKQDGGVLEYTLREVEAECLPTEIPDRLEIDVAALRIGDSLHVKDLSVPSSVKILSDPELTFLTVKPPHVEKVAEEVPSEEITEPEVITEKKPVEAAEVEEEKKRPGGEAKKKAPEESKKKGEAKGV